MTHRVVLPKIGTFEAWRGAARKLIAAGVAPQEVEFAFEEDQPGLFGTSDLPDTPAPPVKAGRRFVHLARLVACHSEPAHLVRLYALLCRWQTAPVDLANRSDRLVGPLHVVAKEIRRDRHKMTAFVRFRELPNSAGRRRFAAWFEPDHHIVAETAPFFVRRLADMDWAIATPHAVARFADGVLSVDPPGETPDLPEDAAEDLWRTYYASIFNPARLKVSAMCAEMPKKYWGNLPEAALIPDLIAQAQARSDAMRARVPTTPPRFAAQAAAPARVQAEAHVMPDSLDALRREAAGCTRCPLHAPATQIVFGEGPQDADLMIVGEQPGDREDLQGRPFVGPAGQLFDRLALAAGLDRGRAYVTNAVKHFKFAQRGRQRLHQRPSAGEITECRWWLDLEREFLRPKLTVALGATALHALTGDGRGILKRRGGIEQARDGGPVFVTVHPSYLLRLPDTEARLREEAAFIADLRRVANHPTLA